MTTRIFRNGEGFGEYADGLSPEEQDSTVVTTTVTAIRSLEIDLESALVEKNRLRGLITAVRDDCEWAVKRFKNEPLMSYADGLQDQAACVLKILDRGTGDSCSERGHHED